MSLTPEDRALIETHAPWLLSAAITSDEDEADIAALLAVAREQPRQPPEDVREKVARLIDPKAWDTFDRVLEAIKQAGLNPDDEPGRWMSVEPSLAKADAILALPAVAVGDGWRPIETAPKDGTVVLLFCPKGDGNPGSTYRVTAGEWCSDPGGTTEYRDGEGRYIGQDDRDGFEGWLSWDGGFSEDTMMPTHWQPLPAPPHGGGG